MKALSIRQPWAWLIVNGYKDIENRDWPTKVRGPVLIHASGGMTKIEYETAADFADTIGVKVPAFHELQRGGIVGQAEIIDCVSESASPWFFGKYGFVIANAKKIDFSPLRGNLGFFEAGAQGTKNE